MSIKHDETLSRALKFAENIRDRRPAISNLYVFTLIDKDGNIVDEKYGMNLMTNAGFAAIYKDGASFVASENVGLYLGTSDNDITVGSNAMGEYAAFGGLRATNLDVSITHDFPLYYAAPEQGSSTTGLITLISKFLKCKYPATITNFSGNTRITEYGIGTSAQSLWTHSHIYDALGRRGDMTKYDGTELVIHVYMCISFYESLIQDGWANNRHLLITANDIMFSRMIPSKMYSFKRYSKYTDRTGTPSVTIQTATPNAYTNSIILPEFRVQQTGETENGYIDGFVLKSSGFTMIEPEYLSEPENITIDGFVSLYPWKYDGFASAFGYTPSNSSQYSMLKHPPITHLLSASCNLYDANSGTWTNTLDYYNTSTKYYDEAGSNKDFCQPITYYSAAAGGGTTKESGYVFQNLHPEDPITKITTGGVSVYATNKYWYMGNPLTNVSPDDGWVWITNYNNIPAACRSARFWIVNSNAEDLVFVREKQPFQLYEKGTNANGCSTASFPTESGWGLCTGNQACGCYLRGSNLYVPATDTKRAVSIGTYNTASSYGNWIIAFNNPCTAVKCIDVTNPTTSSPVTNVALTWSNSDSGSSVFKSETGTGYFVAQSMGSSNSCYIIDMTGTTPTATSKAWKYAGCIYGTNYVAYTLATDVNTIYIYDCSTNSNVGSSITNPIGSDIRLMIGNGSYLWIIGSSSTYVADLRLAGRPTYACTNTPDLGIYNNPHKLRMTAVTEGLLLYNSSSPYNLAHTMYFPTASPTSCARLPDGFNAPGALNLRDNVSYDLVVAQEATIAGSAKRSIALVITCQTRNYSSTPDGSDSRVFDFGQYINGGNAVLSQQWASNYTYTNWIVYGNKIVHELNNISPIINYMPHKLVGTTDTITTLNSAKRIVDKHWYISYGNIPLWGDEINGSGKPPGTPIARTDIAGQITGWS